MKKILFSLIFMNLLSLNALADDKLTLPDFSLQDPAGATFTKKDILKGGLVMIVTAPILSSENAQRGWSDSLEKTRKTKNNKFVMLEDFSPSAFKGIALSQMKKEYVAGVEPVLLVDPAGELRQKLGVESKATVVLVFNTDGKLIHQEAGKPSLEAAAKIWELLKK